ncbi:MAG: hypothetical protein ACJ739_12425 [Acidimicrobiales bacterium]
MAAQPGEGRWSRAAAMGARTAVVGFVLAGVLFAAGALEPWRLLAAGETGPSRAVVVRDFPDAELVDGPGYDGQQFYAIAAELPDLKAAERNVDEPRYRLLRILAPLIASAAPDGDATVLALLALNIVGLALSVWGLAALCESTGRRPSLGWLALVPIFLPTFLTVADPLATGLALAGLALVVRGDLWPGVAVLAAGCLTREGTAALVIGAGAGLLLTRRRIGPPAALALSLVPLAGWFLYLSRTVDGAVTNRWVVLGFLDASPGLIALGAACFLIGVAAAWGWRDQPPVALAAAAVAVQIPFFLHTIFLPLNISRVTAPMLALGLAIVVGEALERRAAPPRPAAA